MKRQNVALILVILACYAGQAVQAMEMERFVPIAPIAPAIPLWEAANRGDEEAVRWYIAHRGEQGIDINAVSPGGESPLALAANQGNEEIVNLLLGAGANPNTHNINGHTALHFALFQSRKAIAKALIENGADANAKDNHRSTPLMEAAHKGFFELVQLLIDRGARVDDVCDFGYTARRFALQFGHRNIVQILDQASTQQQAEALYSSDEYDDEENSENYDQEGDEGSEELASIWGALADGDIELVLWYIQNEDSVDARNEFGETPLMLAAAFGYEEIVRELLVRGAQINATENNGNSALMLALMKIHVPIARMLLEAGANPRIINKNGETAWWIASNNYLKEILDILRAMGVNSHESLTAIAYAQEHERMLAKRDACEKRINIKKGTYIPSISCEQAVKSGDVDAVNWYLANKQDVNRQNEKGETLLMIASLEGQHEVVKMLVDAGAQLDLIDADGNTALLRSLMAGDRRPDWGQGPKIYLRYGSDDELDQSEEEQLPSEGTQTVIARMLLDAGADWKIKNHLHQNALLLAVRQGKDNIVKQLLALGADPNQVTEGDYDYSMLMLAAYLCRDAVITELVAGGANINARDDDDVTALMIAASRGFCNTVETLLQLGADVVVRDILGGTALDHARKANDDECIALLEAAEQSLVVPLVTTPLIRAIYQGKIDKVCKLIAHKIDVNEQDGEENRPLSAAARIGSLKIVELLLQHGARIDAHVNACLRPLHAAVMGGYIEIVRLLLDLGADVNAPDSYRGRSPLHWAVRMTVGSVEKLARQVPVEKSAQIIELLLKRGADPAQKDLENKTALDWAEHQNLQPLVAILAPVTPAKSKQSAPKAPAKAKDPVKAKAVPKVAPKAPAAPKKANAPKQKEKVKNRCKHRRQKRWSQKMMHLGMRIQNKR